MKHIEEIAFKLLNKLKIKQLPIKPSKIADKLGIKHALTDLGDNISGVLVFQNSEAKIGINAKDIVTRQNFTFAHELGHYVLHVKSNPNEDKLFVDDLQIMFRKNTSSRKEMMQERQANAFAAALLMPSNLIDLELDKIKNKTPFISEDKIVSKLSRKCGVSDIAMTYRLINLGYFNHSRSYH